MNDLENLAEIASRLRRLQQTSPTTKDGLAAWYSEGRGFAQWVGLQHSAVDLPEEVWHYLHDADIRAKDPERREQQDRMLGEIIASLERGNIPESPSVTVSVRPRWLGALALLLVATIICSVVR